MVFLNQTSKDSWLTTFRPIRMQFELYMIAEIQASWWLIKNELALWEQEVFCDLPCNSNFWVASDTCNSPYLYNANVIRQVTKLQLTIYTVQLIITQLQLCHNSFPTIM
jgi:hypothetical protein